MSMDGLSLHASIWELQALVGGKIDKVQQPDGDALVFVVRTPQGTKRLLINSHAQNGRMHLTGATFENPETAPAFCMLLRKRLTGGRIASIEQLGLDRVAVITILAKDEFFDETRCRLMVELMGKYSNITLVAGDGRVVDAIHRVPLGVSSVRAVLPGLPYEAPPAQDKVNPLALSDEVLKEYLFCDEEPAALIQKHFQGFSKATAKQLVLDCPDRESIFRRLTSLREGPFPIHLLRNSLGEPIGVYPFPVPESERLNSLSEAYDLFYFERDRIVHIQRRGSALRRSVENLLRRDEHKLAAYNDAIDNEGRFEEHRLFGELLMANLYQFKRGDDKAVVQNYYADPPEAVTIPLDPLLSPSENAERYFKLYKKSRTARAYALERKDALLEEIQYLEGQLDNIEKCQTTAELNEIRQELVNGKFLRAESGKKRPPKNVPSKPMHYRSSDGIDLFVGKNNVQNDALTLRQATGSNYFVHAKNIPGSHVLIQFDGEPPMQTLTEACQLAAYYSKARSSALVPVDYTPRKFVKKPSGALPGKVIYSTNRTAYITPDPNLIASLARLD